MDVDFGGHPLWQPLCPSVEVASEQFLLLGIYRDHRLGSTHLLQHAGIDVFKLRVSIRMLLALNGLAVALETIAHSMEKHTHQTAASRIPLTGQFL